MIVWQTWLVLVLMIIYWATSQKWFLDPSASSLRKSLFNFGFQEFVISIQAIRWTTFENLDDWHYHSLSMKILLTNYHDEMYKEIWGNYNELQTHT